MPEATIGIPNPDFAKAAAAKAAAYLPPLLLAAERIAATVEQGVHGRRRIGPGDVFWQYRLYYPGDELRRLDWRASAKSDRLYLRQQEWAAAQSTYLWCDLSASMRFSGGRDRPQKIERAQILTLALAHMLIRAGERIALMDAPEPPIAGRAALERLAESLFRKARQPAGSSLPPDRPLPSHAQAILIGDFLSPLPEIEARIAPLSGRGIRGHLLQVLDAAEIDLPFAGRIRFLGPEGEGSHVVSRGENLREDYRRRLDAHRAGLREIARRCGWTMTEHATSEPANVALLSAYRWLTADRLRRR